MRIPQTKFWASSAIVLIASVYLLFGIISEGTWANVVLWTIGLYGGANIGATIAHNGKDEK